MQHDIALSLKSKWGQMFVSNGKPLTARRLLAQSTSWKGFRISLFIWVTIKLVFWEDVFHLLVISEETCSPHIPHSKTSLAPHTDTLRGLLRLHFSAVCSSNYWCRTHTPSLCASDMPRLTDADGPVWMSARLPAFLVMSLPMGKTAWSGTELWLRLSADLPHQFEPQAPEPEVKGRLKTTSAKWWQSKKLLVLLKNNTLLNVMSANTNLIGLVVLVPSLGQHSCLNG